MSRNPIIPSKEKVLEQEPEILPCRAAASPLSPQPSAAGTPRLLGPSIKVWDPCNVLLLPPPPPLMLLPRGVATMAADRITEVLLIAHGECAASLRTDLVGGRWTEAAGLTSNGERQARALAVFLKSQGVRFDEVYTSPLDRARATSSLVCRVTLLLSQFRKDRLSNRRSLFLDTTLVCERRNFFQLNMPLGINPHSVSDLLAATLLLEETDGKFLCIFIHKITE